MRDEKIIKLLSRNAVAGMKALMKKNIDAVYDSIISEFPEECEVKDVEECISDVFCDFYRKPAKYDPAVSGVKEFLVSSSPRVAAEYLKKHKIRKNNFESVASDTSDKESAAGSNNSAKKKISRKRIKELTLKKCELLKKMSLKKKVLISVIASILLVAIGAGIAIPLILNKNKKYVGHVISEETFAGSHYKGNVFSPSRTDDSILIPSWLSYTYSISFVAEVKEVLPDTYMRVEENQSERYRVFNLSVKEVLGGYGVKDDVYYLLPEKYYTDLSAYETLILAVSPVAGENYIMVNETQKRLESFSYVFECYDKDYGPVCGCVLPFNNGALDSSIWEKEGWNSENNALNTFLDDDFAYGFNVIKGMYLENVKDEVKKILKLNDPNSAYNLSPQNYAAPFIPENIHKDAKKYLESIAPFKNGSFYTSIPRKDESGSDRYVDAFRMVNGFATREESTVDLISGEVIRKGESFTKDDLKNMPDIGSVIDSIDLSTVMPTGIPRYDSLERVESNVYGWYTKVNGKVYGIVRITLGYLDSHEQSIYRQGIYTVVTVDGGAKPIERDALRTLIGEDKGIDSYVYGLGEYFPYA